MTFASTAIAGSVAWQVTDKLSVGGGGSWQWLEVEYSAAVMLPDGTDGKVSLEDLDDWTPRYFGGVLYQLSPATSVGVVYRSQWSPDLSGRRKGLRLPINEPFTLGLTLPQQIEAGVQHALSPTWILGITFDWEDWSAFDEIVIETRLATGGTVSSIADPLWHDTYSGGINLTHIVGANFIQVGMNYASSPVSDGNRIIQLPADESFTLTAGIAHNASKTMTYSFGGAVVFYGDAEVKNQDTQGISFSGKFDTNVLFVLGGSLQMRF